jgi:hypothetical protein
MKNSWPVYSVKSWRQSRRFTVSNKGLMPSSFQLLQIERTVGVFEIQYTMQKFTATVHVLSVIHLLGRYNASCTLLYLLSGTHTKYLELWVSVEYCPCACADSQGETSLYKETPKVQTDINKAFTTLGKDVECLTYWTCWNCQNNWIKFQYTGESDTVKTGTTVCFIRKKFWNS